MIEERSDWPCSIAAAPILTRGEPAAMPVDWSIQPDALSIGIAASSVRRSSSVPFPVERSRDHQPSGAKSGYLDWDDYGLSKAVWLSK